MSSDPDQTVVAGTSTVAGAPGLPASPLPDLVLEQELGRGGMGVVYRARQTYLERTVALKLLSAASAEDEFLRRFQREAKILASLSHPHIVACHQAGLTAQRQPYLVMEFIDGPDLRRQVDAHGPLPARAAVTVVRDLAAALDHAHRAGIIHRDVKPENVLLAKRPAADPGDPFPYVAKLVDLGLARPAHGGGDMHLTRQGTILGTPSTMAPEQFDDPDHIDFRADIYGLGCVLYHALTGAPAFTGTSIAQLVTAKVHHPAPNPSSAGRAIPPAVTALVTAMLASDRERRPASYADLIARCDAILAGRPSGGRWWPWAAVAGMMAVGVAVLLARPGPSSGAAAPVAAPRPQEVPGASAPSNVPAVPPAPVVAPVSRDPATVADGEWGRPSDLWRFDAAQRLKDWTAARDALWVSSEGLDNGISGLNGRIRRPLAGNGPWRIDGALVLHNRRGFRSESVQVGVILDDGSSVALNLINLGKIFHSQVNVYDPMEEIQPALTRGPLVLKPADSIPFRLTVGDRALIATIDGSTIEPAPLPHRPVALYLGAMKGVAPVELSALSLRQLP